MNKMKKHSKKLAALLSAFQFFGSGAQKTKGMENMGKEMSKGLAEGFDAKAVKNLEAFLDNFKRAISDSKVIYLNNYNTAYQEIFNPTKNNKTFRYDFSKELQKVWNASFYEAMCCGLPEETPTGEITGFKSLEDMGYETQEEKKEAAKRWAIIKCLEKQKTLITSDTMDNVIRNSMKSSLFFFFFYCRN